MPAHGTSGVFGWRQPQSARADLIPGRFLITLDRNQRKLAAADALATLAEQHGLTLITLC
ncbi:hypothetical protein SAMN04489716_1273 [Actinoplanes derwentensis]|uniref:Uncharacterized protein n=1 Tax=Actinoplanes derwentensis TaxID=113562 RepID=A0A1H1TYJ6_9ACTN|nr:hypothetical protein Ade03nite_88090 [Actinoplanes derwentensis]SDS65026.1 hypothetical protein SAMN04489716_1273 [Actinoplanes derwentensis]